MRRLLFSRCERHYILYHASDDQMHISEVTADLRHPTYMGVLLVDTLSAVGTKVANPFLYVNGEAVYMWHDLGSRLHSFIALSKAIDECND